MDLHLDLATLGWNDFFAAQCADVDEQSYAVGRITLEHKRMYRIFSVYGELLGEVAGKFRFEAEAAGREHFPAVGDWVVFSVRPEGRATIHRVLQRKSQFMRKVAGTTHEAQIVAANVDTVFLVNALNRDFNLRRLERYLVLAWESSAEPVIVLSKADLCADSEAKVAEVAAIASGVPIHVVSAHTNEGMAALTSHLGRGRTVALLGSSGAGKSTLVNAFAGEEVQQVNDVREGDDRGRHTTTYRELIVLPQGGLIVDTPGMRELTLWEADDGFSDAFADIEQLAEYCFFRDCRHEREPNCAVRQAITDGTLAAARYHNYVKLQREQMYLARREAQKAKLRGRKAVKKTRRNQA
nr:ribosome small subunit-dependent GTPase A [Numidum massiliense]